MNCDNMLKGENLLTVFLKKIVWAQFLSKPNLNSNYMSTKATEFACYLIKKSPKTNKQTKTEKKKILYRLVPFHSRK